MTVVPVGVHVAPGVALLPRRAARLVGAHGDLCVPVAPEGALVDVGAADEHVAVVHDLHDYIFMRKSNFSLGLQF